MGANHGKDEAVSPIPPPTSLTIRNLLNLPKGEVQHNTLEKSLKSFLRRYNMSGLEYRLRLAGIYTLTDLEMSNETLLSHHGFTRLMARRLYRALYEYYQEDEEVPDFMTNPSVKSSSSKKHSRKFSASPQLKNSVNYGKQNKRRIQNVRQSAVARDDSIKRSGSPIGRKISVTPPVTYTPTVIGASGTSSIDLVDNNQTSPLPEVNVEHEEDTPPSKVDDPPAVVVNDVLPDVISSNEPVLEEVPIAGGGLSEHMVVADGYPDSILQQSPMPIDHHLSMPMGLEQEHGAETPLQTGSFINDRSLSCPCLAMLSDKAEPDRDANPRDDFNEILLTLQNHEVRDVEELLMYLHTILDILKTSCLTSVENAFVVMNDIISRHLHNLVVVEVSCRVLRYLTLNLSHNCSSTDILMKVVHVALNVIKVHPVSKKCQLNGCLVINNLFRSGYITEVDTDFVLSVLSQSLEYYQKDEVLCLGILTAMVSTLSSVTEPSSVSQQMQLCLVQLCVLMDTFGDNVQLLQFILSFFTLSLVNVAALVDDSIMVTLIPLVSQQLVTHKDNVEVVVHACKAISQLAHHKLIEDEDISTELADHLVDCLLSHPKSSRVQTWGSYALYQLSSYNNSLIPYVKNSGCLEQRKHSLPHLNEEARSYVEQLAKLATL